MKSKSGVNVLKGHRLPAFLIKVMSKKKPTHGGARKGAGRPVTKEPTVVMRIPESLVEAVKKLLKKRGKN